MKKITFNYSIGDIVTLIKEPSWDNRALIGYNRDFKPKEYRIRGLKYIVDKDGEKILYSLYAYCDEYIQYHNWMDESRFTGEGKKQEIDIEFMSIDKKELNIGDKVYSDIYYGSYNDASISPDFTFTSYGQIVKLSYTEEGRFLIDDGIDISVSYDGTADAIKYWMNDTYDKKYTFNPRFAVKDIDDKFIKDYILACKENRFNPFSDKIRASESEKVNTWLNIMGIYDKVKDNYKKITVRKKINIEKDTTVDDIISSLTDKQKKELLKKLSK